jgi:hypothetical protein
VAADGIDLPGAIERERVVLATRHARPRVRARERVALRRREQRRFAFLTRYTYTGTQSNKFIILLHPMVYDSILTLRRNNHGPCRTQQ